MCNNIIVLWLFIILKIIALVILPIIIIIKRKKNYVTYIIIADIALLLFFLICNIFTVNSCVYNSSMDGIKRVKKHNEITLYNEIHPNTDYGNNPDGIEPEKNYTTATGKNLYYFNQNKAYMKTAYYTCFHRLAW